MNGGAAIHPAVNPEPGVKAPSFGLPPNAVWSRPTNH